MEDLDPGDEEYWKMEEFEDYAKSCKSHGKLSWIWRKGVNLGKKMVVTGVVVSSAPFVLPPLMALSAIGFAFSVPAGFVFATYACGEKLMSTLLPMPSSPSFEEYESLSSDEEEYWVYRDDFHKGYEENEDNDVEENDFEEDIRKEMEMRIELIEENSEDIDYYDQTPVVDNKDNLDIRSSKASEIVEEGGYEEDVGEYMEDEEQHLDPRAISKLLGKLQEEENEISFMNNEGKGMPGDSIMADVLKAQVGGEDEDNVEQVMEEMAFVPPKEMKEEDGCRRTSAGIEDGMYEENAKEYMEDEEQHLNSPAVCEIIEGIREAENEIPFMENEGEGVPRYLLRAVVLEAQLGGENENNVEQVTDEMAFVSPRDMKEEDGCKMNPAGIEEGELKRETTGLVERMQDEAKNDEKSTNRPEKGTLEENEDLGRVPINYISEDKGNKNLNVIPEEVEPIIDDKAVLNGLENDVNIDYISFEEDGSGLMHDQPNSAAEAQLVANVKMDGDHTVTEVYQGTVSEKLGILIFSNEDTSKLADNSGFGSSNNGFVVPDRVADPVDKMTEGEDLCLNNVVEVNVDYHEVVIESAMLVSEGAVLPVSEEAETAPIQGTTAGLDKVQLDEEKIWEQINAMRMIVGYTNAPHSSYAEELKALYVFTGVEPPVSSKDSVDLADIKEELHFLMSIVGVK